MATVWSGEDTMVFNTAGRRRRLLHGMVCRGRGGRGLRLGDSTIYLRSFGRCLPIPRRGGFDGFSRRSAEASTRVRKETSKRVAGRSRARSFVTPDSVWWLLENNQRKT